MSGRSWVQSPVWSSFQNLIPYASLKLKQSLNPYALTPLPFGRQRVCYLPLPGLRQSGRVVLTPALTGGGSGTRSVCCQMQHANIRQLGGCFLGWVGVLHRLPISASSSAEGCFLSRSGAPAAPIDVDLGGTSVPVFAPLAVVGRAPSQGLWARASMRACDTGYPLAFGLGVYGELTPSSPPRRWAWGTM